MHRQDRAGDPGQERCYRLRREAARIRRERASWAGNRMREEQELMNTRVTQLMAVCVICVACVAAGCQSRDSRTSGGTKTLKLAFVTNNSADFWTIARSRRRKSRRGAGGR